MNGGHQPFDDAEPVVNDLGERSETVGGAGGVGNHLQIGGVSPVIDPHDEHGASAEGAEMTTFLRRLSGGRKPSPPL